MFNTQKAQVVQLKDPADPPSQTIKDLVEEVYNDGVKRGRDECLAYLRGAMGRTSSCVSDLEDYLSGLEK